MRESSGGDGGWGWGGGRRRAQKRRARDVVSVRNGRAWRGRNVIMRGGVNEVSIWNGSTRRNIIEHWSWPWVYTATLWTSLWLWKVNVYVLSVPSVMNSLRFVNEWLLVVLLHMLQLSLSYGRRKRRGLVRFGRRAFDTLLYIVIRESLRRRRNKTAPVLSP